MLGMEESQLNAVTASMEASECVSQLARCTTTDNVRDAPDAVGHNSDGTKEVRLRRFISL